MNFYYLNALYFLFWSNDFFFENFILNFMFECFNPFFPFFDQRHFLKVKNQYFKSLIKFLYFILIHLFIMLINSNLYLN